jgi:hypothetical protein
LAQNSSSSASLREAVLAIGEVLVEGRAARFGPLDHVSHRNLLEAELAARDQHSPQQPLAWGPAPMRAGEGNDQGGVVVRKHNPFV